MIKIYTNKKNSENYVIFNDSFFNLNTSNETMSDKEAAIIYQIDNAKLLSEKRIETKFGIGNIRNLSTGCKTVLNIVKHPDMIVCVDGCGTNVLDYIFQMEDANILMTSPGLVDIDPDTEIMFNDNEIVIGKSGVGRWWEQEYKRREANDL